METVPVFWLPTYLSSSLVLLISFTLVTQFLIQKKKKDNQKDTFLPANYPLGTLQTFITFTLC